MSGPFGFRDWQRQSGWDSPILADIVAQTFGLAQTFGPYDVRQWQSVVARIGCSNPARWVFRWYDGIGGSQVGRHEVVTRPEIAQDAVLTFANLGPFLYIDLFPNPAANSQTDLVLFASNRIYSRLMSPQFPQLMTVTAQNVPANSQATFWPATFFAGRAKALVFMSQAGWFFDASAYSDTGTANRFYSVSAGGAVNTWITYDWIIPPTAWQIVVTNAQAVAMSAYVFVTPDYTGS